MARNPENEPRLYSRRDILAALTGAALIVNGGRDINPVLIGTGSALLGISRFTSFSNDTRRSFLGKALLVSAFCWGATRFRQPEQAKASPEPKINPKPTIIPPKMLEVDAHPKPIFRPGL